MADWPHLFIVKQFFEPQACDAIVAEMKTVAGSAATVYGRSASGTIDENARRTFRAQPAPETVQLVTERLWSLKDSIEQHFDVALSECEEPQFLRYREGDFFVAHQDGNTGMLLLETERRLISTVIFLNRAAELPELDGYKGGELVFSDLRNRYHCRAEPGTLVAFRSETTHEVTPVTHGERYSIASWYK